MWLYELLKAAQSRGVPIWRAYLFVPGHAAANLDRWSDNLSITSKMRGWYVVCETRRKIRIRDKAW